MYFYAAFSFDNTSLGLHVGPQSDPNPEFGILWSAVMQLEMQISYTL